MSEKDLITKYVPSYVNPQNPSSWATISSFSANEILNGGESVYGLLEETRYEISVLLKHLGEIDEETDKVLPNKKYGVRISNYNDYFLSKPRMTIHDYFEEVKEKILAANKLEKK